MNQINNYRGDLAVAALCAALGIPRSTTYRKWSKKNNEQKSPLMPLARFHPRALCVKEQAEVIETLHSERFLNQSPAEIYATLLDEGRYLCSVRTFYRILKKQGENHERRAITRHGAYSKPELLATGPNQVWSWDITKLLGPEKWTYFHLYVLLDIFSRYVVGWMVADYESGALAQSLIAEACERQSIKEGTLTIHSDRGGPMISKPVAHLMSDLGIVKSLSRPQVSNDNPFSEAHFKTLKYCPAFPDRFGSKIDSQEFCRPFFKWYNGEHKHSGIGFYTPADVHYGKAPELKKLRQETLNKAFTRHPERFVKKSPTATEVPTAVWINPPVFPKGSVGFTPQGSEPEARIQRKGNQEGRQPEKPEKEGGNHVYSSLAVEV